MSQNVKPTQPPVPMFDKFGNGIYVSEEDAAKNCAAGFHDWRELGGGPEAFCLHCAATKNFPGGVIVPPEPAPDAEMVVLQLAPDQSPRVSMSPCGVCGEMKRDSELSVANSDCGAYSISICRECLLSGREEQCPDDDMPDAETTPKGETAMKSPSVDLPHYVMMPAPDAKPKWVAIKRPDLSAFTYSVTKRTDHAITYTVDRLPMTPDLCTCGLPDCEHIQAVRSYVKRKRSAPGGSFFDARSDADDMYPDNPEPASDAEPQLHLRLVRADELTAGQTIQILGSSSKIVGIDSNETHIIIKFGKSGLVTAKPGEAFTVIEAVAPKTESTPKGETHSRLIVSFPCELCGGKVTEGECDTCESHYDDNGKRVPDKYDDPSYFAPAPAASEALTEKTREEIDRLKFDWARDPIWDIETTEGFEAHRDELMAWGSAKKEQWKQLAHEKLVSKATELGTDNLTLAAYVLRLEARIAALESSREGK